ncbi:MAG: IS110 family transposase [Spirochaetes bacterium]|nr:IS110 family transposase [Spirochaetota bacterium]
MNYIGIDLHSDRFTCTFLSKGDNTETTTFILNEKGLDGFLAKCTKEDYVALEASSPTFSFYDLIKHSVKKVLVLDPFQLQLIYKSGKKNDKIDSKKIAKLLKYHIEADKDFLPIVYVPDKEIRKLRALFTTYKLYIKELVAIKNRIYSILRENLHGIKKKSVKGKKYRSIIVKFDICEEYKYQIKSLYKTMDHLYERIDEIKKEIYYLGKHYREEIVILTSILGVSPFIALALKADYADVNRFKNAKHFSSYLRAVPKLDASNDKIKNGSTKKRGRPLGISLLLQSLNHIKRVSPKISEFYARLKTGKSAGKVRMAIMRKMFVTIYYMLREKKYFGYYIKETHEAKMAEYDQIVTNYEENKKAA